jgi:hypothetical protein
MVDTTAIDIETNDLIVRVDTGRRRASCFREIDPRKIPVRQ